MAIKSNEDFKVFMNSGEFGDSKLSNLSENDLAFFSAQLKFSKDGVPASYWGDIMRMNDFNESTLAEFVSATFGVDKNEFSKCLHYFGDGQGNCTRRLYWNCPDC